MVTGLKQKELAVLLGVSEATVAKALRGSHEISEELREKIRSEAKRLGCKKTPRKVRRRMNILVIVPEFRSEFYGEVLGLLNIIARERGLNIFAAETNFDDERISDLLPTRAGFFDGIIIEGPSIEDPLIVTALKRGDIPVVTVNSRSSKFDDISSDIYSAMLEVLERLRASGRKRIGFVSENNSVGREIAFRKAAAELGILDEDLIFSSKLRFAAAGAEGFEKLFSLPEPPDAIICAYDYIVIGILNAAANAGISVPEKLALVGNDNLRAASSYRLGITTIDQKSRAMYEKVIDRLLARINGDESEPMSIKVKSEIIVRETAVI